MSADLATKILLGLEQLAIVREQVSLLSAGPSASQAGAIETAAASAMLHSFYTEVETFREFLQSPNQPAH